MRILVTGGAGFIGRWVVKQLLEEGHQVTAFDDLSNGRRENIKEFSGNPAFRFIEGDIKDQTALKDIFMENFAIVYHLAASINVQDSIDDPRTTFSNDVEGTFNLLEICREQSTKIVFMSTCMVYDRSQNENGISELSPVKPASPYAASKLAGEALTLSYYYAYGLPAVVLRPFNTYGPFQKSGGEGGVVTIFIKQALSGKEINIYGSGAQTRDLLFVEDCARFVIRAGFSDQANGEILNAGLGEDLSINQLAALIANDPELIKHIEHIHPQSEIQKLKCNYAKAEKLLSWRPDISLEQGLALTKAWIAENPDL
ncbi:MAG: SDR family NAD(P)-dependent oxidoreductase [Syntrophomonadaceae bacterium]|jgi:nucleoside-diphosphate-sugar epimerase|nr:SDR family NAD(P)-dependent oxidoreductase [Syntrophomonadaceae bacterium]